MAEGGERSSSSSSSGAAQAPIITPLGGEELINYGEFVKQRDIIMDGGSSSTKNLLCIFCEKICYEAVILDPCGHSGCKRCTLSSTNVCKCGLNIIDKVKDVKTRKMINSLTVSCTNGGDCKKKMKWEELTNHTLNTCEYRKVNCIYADKGCWKKVTFKFLEDHLNDESNCLYPTIACKLCHKRIQRSTESRHVDSECDMFLLECPHCKKKIMRKNFNDHTTRLCAKIPKTCPYTKLVDDIVENLKAASVGEDRKVLDISRCHFSGSEDDLKHHLKDTTPVHIKLVVDAIIAYNNETMERIKKGWAKTITVEDHLCQRTRKIETMFYPLYKRTHKENYKKLIRSFLEPLYDADVMMNVFKKNISDYGCDEEDLYDDDNNGGGEYKNNNNNNGGREYENDNGGDNNNSNTATASTSAAAATNVVATTQPPQPKLQELFTENEHLRQKINQLEQWIIEMDYRLSRERVIYDGGSLIWKIGDYNQLKLESKRKQSCPMYSPPLYIPDKFGYKTCLKIYLNGVDGGKNTHLSIYFIIMRGDYDALLEWPFNRKIQITIRSIKNDYPNMIQEITPKAGKLNIWGKPTTDMNMATGWSQFITHRSLEQDDFLENDRIFIQLSFSNPISLDPVAAAAAASNTTRGASGVN